MKKTIPPIPFYFIRHGQTDWNLKEMWQGWIDVPLNEHGHEQARSAITALSGKGITRIISSPLIRAHKTAEIINEHLRVPLLLVDGLKECSLGVLEGTLKDQSTTSKDLTHIALMGKGEHPDDFKTRIATALHDLLDPKHTTLVVAHGGVYWAIMEMIGFKEQRSHNCIPYLFIPPTEKLDFWSVYPVDEI